MRTCLLLILLLLPHCAEACTSLGTNPIGFPSVGGGGNSTVVHLADIQIECTQNFKVALGGGQHLSGARRMTDGSGHFIEYSLWRDAGAADEWGTNGVTVPIPYPAPPLSNTGTGALQTFSVFGFSHVSQFHPPGEYQDWVQVTLAYSPYGPTDRLESSVLITLTVLGQCTLNVGGLGGFGSWPLGAANLENIPLGSVSVGCTAGMNFAMGIDGGFHWQDGIRHMEWNGNRIPYRLWADAAGTIPWGDGGLSAVEPGYAETVPGEAGQTGSGDGTTQTFFVWGDAMIAGFPAGIYEDNVMFTVVWP